MSEDSQSQYRMEAGDRLNGLGQRRKKPKKVLNDTTRVPEYLAPTSDLVSLLVLVPGNGRSPSGWRVHGEVELLFSRLVTADHRSDKISSFFLPEKIVPWRCAITRLASPNVTVRSSNTVSLVH
ncbi:hypothetical protein DPEC_G00101110 [Dallia pectoralis]|uniref:Uncharacterized protein n=1 Tax=Dallia pectoralis TaxID=75939 RepID=A0ACC2GWP9_DALPE|nr:hypothetical protein DPEC_G00101110 [Dallia pectoralis]